MIFYAEIASGKVAALLQTDAEMPFPHVIISNYDSALLGHNYNAETGEFSQPQQPTHKTTGIEKSDWRSLFTITEAIRFRNVIKNIDGDLSFLSGAAVLQSPCGIENIESMTWLTLLQLSIDEWSDARLINTADPRTALSMSVFSAVGILDAPQRAAVILQGVPI